MLQLTHHFFFISHFLIGGICLQSCWILSKLEITLETDCVAVVFQGQRGPKGLPVSG